MNSRFGDWIRDFQAGLVVFLVALPLCLGIALASGAPLFSGIITGVVGGILVSILSGASLAVSGPAAGLTVIVAQGIQSVGTYEAFLTAVVLAGAIQMILGRLKAGFIGDLFPVSVIKGMLAGIGVIIILKQIPHALGRDSNFELDDGFWMAKSNALAEIFAALQSFSTGAVIITTLSLVILALWETKAIKKFAFSKIVPAPLIVVFLGVAANALFRSRFPDWELKGEHLVALPIFDGLSELGGALRFPDFGAFSDRAVWTLALTIAVIASIESLLSVEAIDKLDPWRRITPTNRELFAQGAGNLVSGLIGGIPMTAVIVRGSANVFAGGKTWRSSFLHGVLLLVCALTIPHWLNLVPLSSLAAVLILLGYKLATPDRFKAMARAGMDQFVPFVATVLVTTFSDLLTGVLVGLGIGLSFVVKGNVNSAFTVVRKKRDFLISFTKDVSFLNKTALKQILARIPEATHVYIDGSRAKEVDSDIKSVLEDFAHAAQFRNITVEISGIHERDQSASEMAH